MWWSLGALSSDLSTMVCGSQTSVVVQGPWSQRAETEEVDTASFLSPQPEKGHDVTPIVIPLSSSHRGYSGSRGGNIDL